jgi:hypothetical protein
VQTTRVPLEVVVGWGSEEVDIGGATVKTGRGVVAGNGGGRALATSFRHVPIPTHGSRPANGFFQRSGHAVK